MKILLATGNAGKVRDFRGMEPDLVVELLPEYGSAPVAVEDGRTFEENARKKAEYYSRLNPELVLADDSGIEVDALGGAPGVDSALFAGKHGDDEANNDLLLERMKGVSWEQRTARFVCVLALAQGGRTVAAFRGTTEGYVMEQRRGSGGFGYDVLFYSPEAGCGFAELTAEQKAVYSHRGRAVAKLLEWARRQAPATWRDTEAPTGERAGE